MDLGLIDNSIILEPFTNFKANKKNYKLATLSILKVPNKLGFKPCISLSTLGELNLILLEKKNLIESIKDKRNKMQEILDGFFENCDKIGLDKEAIKLAENILSEDNRLDPVDVIHFTSAISKKCKYFLFIDGKLETSEVIKKYAKENSLALVPFNIKKNEDKGKPDRNLTWI